MSNDSDRKPVADDAEADAYFPSPFSLTQYVAPKTDFDGADYPNAQKGGKWKVLLIATQERYLEMADGKFFSTGNHPVEMLLPMLHLDAAGFERLECAQAVAALLRRALLEPPELIGRRFGGRMEAE